MKIKRMKPGDRRAAILSAAAVVFAQLGYEGATTSRLADAAGISEPVLYRHFPDKEQLYCETLDWAAGRTIGDWESITGGMDNIREQLLAITTVNHQLAGDQGSPYTVLLSASTALAHTGAIRDAAQAAFYRLEQYLTSLIRRGQVAGQLRSEISPSASAWMLLSLGFAYRLTRELDLTVSGDRAWEIGAGSRYLDTLT